jgi:hypothetical protein
MLLSFGLALLTAAQATIKKEVNYKLLLSGKINS